MDVVEQEAQARRREVGRTILSLGRALSSALEIFNRTKEDPSAREAARQACDEALQEMRRSFDALWELRRSLDRPSTPDVRGDAYPRLSRPRLSRPSLAH